VVTLPQHGSLAQAYSSAHLNAEITHTTLIIMAVMQNHGHSQKPWHISKITAKAMVIVNT